MANTIAVGSTDWTDAWSPDLAGADQYTIMFWIKADNLVQRQDNTRLSSVRFNSLATSAQAKSLKEYD